ncbi:3146_t:CDS:1 [Cetraspora pellucida]|uniref:3146_t:CDS:1 n=1 Tax=Cetraspora pellucida TaxID=1433469 RepID=A0A9N9P2Q1_9GLOM|nr:3146_t:CDS:1 [Cetraspora pellucida]
MPESNRRDNEDLVTRPLRDSTSSSAVEPTVPSTTSEPLETSTLKTNSTQKNKRNMLLFFLLMIFVDIGLPILLYYILSKYIPVIWALVISGIPPIVSVILNFIIRKQVNAIGILSIVGFIAGTILSVLQDDPKLYLLRESFITGAVSLVFIVSLIPIKIGSFQMRPLLYYNSKNLGLADLKGLTEDEPIPERFERYWRSYALFRRVFIVMTAVWGFGLLLEVPARILIIYNTKTVDEAVYIGNIVIYSWISCLILFNIIYSGWMKKLGKKREAEAAATAENET